MDFQPFWTSPYSKSIKHPEPIRQLLESLADAQNELYELTFHASSAKKTMTIMRREGKDTQGFSRMQQSFSDAVQKVRSVLEFAASKGFARAGAYTEMTQQAMNSLMELIDDLSLVKDWEVHMAGDQTKDKA